MKWISIISLLMSVSACVYTFATVKNIKHTDENMQPAVIVQSSKTNTATASSSKRLSDKEKAEDMLVSYYDSFMLSASAGEIYKPSALMFVSWVYSEIAKGRPLYEEIENLKPIADTFNNLKVSERQQVVSQAYNRTLAINGDFQILRSTALKNAYVLKDCMLRDLKTDRLKVIEKKAQDINDKGLQNNRISAETINEEIATLAHSVYLLKQFYTADKDVMRDLWPLIELYEATLKEQIELLNRFSGFSKDLQPREIYDIEQTIQAVLARESDANVLMKHFILTVVFMPEMLEKANMSPKDFLVQTEIFAYNQTDWNRHNGILSLGYEDVKLSDLYAKAGVNNNKIQKSAEDIKKLLQVYSEGIGKDLTKRIIDAGGHNSQPSSTVKCRHGTYKPEISIKIPDL